MKKNNNGFISNSPKCLLLGNGINLLFKDPSWESLIKDQLRENGSPFSYDEISKMPATMQIVAATNDTVGERMKDLSDRLLNLHMTEKRVAFLRRVLSLPVDDLLTANYSFELEAADGMELNKRKYSSSLHNTFELHNRHRKFRLFQYYETSNEKRIWHIHGDIAKPDTMLMGHYYYAKQLKDIQVCVAESIKRYNICMRNGEEFRTYSWVDQFLTGDVFALGLSMYLCESDLWYLLCCKKRNYPDTKVYFYDMKCPDHMINIMLKAYGAKIIDGNSLGTFGEYKDFYDAALLDIQRRILE